MEIEAGNPMRENIGAHLLLDMRLSGLGRNVSANDYEQEYYENHQAAFLKARHSVS
ncbi:hypothetical protein FHY18_002740 [Xanthomonas arboricola]|uniref:hypothetical protein n=1 Tax=Xanthomonas sp. 3793 TaxID=3035312 RepID=UPI0021682434|nr:hypothetical protein [Xanthomonas sp. 3793]MCS3747144.1 hypothetical protein [Xanthomonas sp. 3793]